MNQEGLFHDRFHCSDIFSLESIEVCRKHAANSAPRQCLLSHKLAYAIRLFAEVAEMAGDDCRHEAQPSETRTICPTRRVL
ncbi:hypothetical protein RRSWK_01025 [Rhodopirellula sp. SWK7]|nr:hypothetical protein RRSWK_01025 [Rhodopirellula sp. SWK7]